MFDDAYRIAARIKAWMEITNLDFPDLSERGISIERFDDFMESSSDGIVRDADFVDTVADALEIDRHYLESGSAPYHWPWQKRTYLQVFEAYHEFYSRSRGWAKFPPNYLSRFVREKISHHKRYLTNNDLASFSDDLPMSVDEVLQKFREWHHATRS